MIFHVLIVDDEEDVLESLVPGFVRDFARRLSESPAFGQANQAAGAPLPAGGRINVKISAVGYRSAKVAKYAYQRPIHVHLHLCCEKSGNFPHALRLLREQFFAVVVSDLRFADDTIGSRAGRYLIEDVQRRNPDSFAILYSAYQKPEGFPDSRFVRKGSAANLGGQELLEKMVEGFTAYLNCPGVRRFANELGRRGLVYQSDAFGAALRRLYDISALYFGREPPSEPGRRRPRPMLLIDGETGTGKTELAHLLHLSSERRNEPFVAATCNQLTDETFLRSILFGHVKGSFSGATADRPGLVEATGKGILLLDDLHKLSDGASMILHSFLDDGEYSHLGEDEVRRTSAAALVGTVETPRWEAIKANGQLSESFIHRVEQMLVRVPPLRVRPEDIETQARYYTETFSEQIGRPMELSPVAIDWLVDYGFAGGNSRKLRDFLKGVVTAQARVTDYLDVSELHEHAQELGMSARTARVAAPGSLSPASSPQTAPAPASNPDDGGWRTRVTRLAAKAIADECQCDPQAAQQALEKLFHEDLPRLWDEFRRVCSAVNPTAPMEIKLFDELLRYYAIFRTGNPANAARELGMKDNALREFVYSREQKRAVDEDHS
jgi:DNA-binding NtrC family response regulator